MANTFGVLLFNVSIFVGTALPNYQYSQPFGFTKISKGAWTTLDSFLFSTLKTKMIHGTQNVASQIVTAVSFIQNLPQTVESLKIILTLVISIRILLECRIAVNSLKSCITRMHLALVLH